MSEFKPIDRRMFGPKLMSNLELLTAEIDEVAKRVRREATCPNCGFLMVYGEPCGNPHNETPT